MRLIEKNGQAQTFQDGALLNWISVGQRNGILSGAVIYIDDAETLSISKGTVLVRGYRVSFDDEVLVNFSVLPAVQELRYLVLRITVSSIDAIATVITTLERPTQLAKIETTTGIHDFVLGTFNLSTSGITNLILEAKPIDQFQNIPFGFTTSSTWELVDSTTLSANSYKLWEIIFTNVWKFLLLAVVSESNQIFPSNQVIYTLPIDGSLQITGKVPGISDSSCSVSANSNGGTLDIECTPTFNGSIKLYGIRR